MIYYFTPYSLEKDLGKCYNDMMELLPNDDDYACFTDGDAMFTSHDFGHQIQRYTEVYPDCPLFTAMTNRVGTDYQCVKDAWDENNISYHWKFGTALRKSPTKTAIEDITLSTPISGVLILIRKKEWKEVGGFQSGKGMLGIDNSIHYKMRDAGYPIYLMKGVYILHYYRDGQQQNKQHLL